MDQATGPTHLPPPIRHCSDVHRTVLGEERPAVAEGGDGPPWGGRSEAGTEGAMSSGRPMCSEGADVSPTAD